MGDRVRALPNDDGADAIDHTSLRRLQFLLDGLRTAVFVVDLVSRRGLFGNAAAAELMRTTDLGLQQLLDADLAELAGPDTAARIEQGLATLLSGAARNYQGDRTYLDCLGEIVHADHAVTRLDLCDASPVGVGVVSRRLGGQTGLARGATLPAARR
jgi:hypothetical protein